MAVTERGLTVKAIDSIRAALRGAVVIKHSDRFTPDVPDYTVTHFGATAWIENKLRHPGQRLKDIVKLGQLQTCCALDSASNGRCWITVYSEHPRIVTVWKPSALLEHVRPTGQWTPAPWAGPLTGDLLGYINTFGAVDFDGWGPGVEARLLLRSFSR